MAERVRLPNRRPCVTQRIEGGGMRAHATVGFDRRGRPRELFLRPVGARSGSVTDFLLDDVAVAISVALQHGVTAEALRKSMGAVVVPGAAAPASIVGAALDLLAAWEAPS